MRDHTNAQPAVVVGIDGSHAAVDAAVWAAPEAASRDIPLRFVFAIDSADNPSPVEAARRLAAAELAIRHAFTTVESADPTVKIEVEILQENPMRALIEASRSAVMLCVGALGIKRATQDGVGSTAAALAASAHCPVAIVRTRRRAAKQTRWVVAEVDTFPAAGSVLGRALEEAELRSAPLRVLTTWQSRYTDIHDSHAVADGNRLAKAQLDRRLEADKHRYPRLDVQAVAVHGSTLHYLAKHVDAIQLVVVGRQRVDGVADLIGPTGHAALHDTECSILVCEPQGEL